MVLRNLIYMRNFWRFWRRKGLICYRAAGNETALLTTNLFRIPNLDYQSVHFERPRYQIILTNCFVVLELEVSAAIDSDADNAWGLPTIDQISADKWFCILRWSAGGRFLILFLFLKTTLCTAILFEAVKSMSPNLFSLVRWCAQNLPITGSNFSYQLT